MSHALSPRTYVILGIALVLMTVLTVSLSFIDMAGRWHIAIGLTVGFCKATLVVVFFMHALISSRLTWLVIAVVCFWLVVLLFGLTFADYFTRGLLPYTPGH
jgi:caa(3)-type oxidase subunit IV